MIAALSTIGGRQQTFLICLRFFTTIGLRANQPFSPIIGI